ncbi:MAG TPA: aromatic ring-hydroxylating dioxygenase subunit alpha, partial [Acidimicrobiales bacterium]
MLRSPIPLAELDATQRPLRQASTLPPACYSSAAFYEFEKEAIFYREWFCVGRAEQIPEPGDYLRVDIADEPVLVLRDGDGGIRAFSAVCRHRAALVVSDERGNCGRNIRCPYHWWTYGFDGRLMGAPAMHETEGFDRHDVALPPFQVEVWNGFVFVNLDAEAAPLAPRLHKFDSIMANYDASNLVTSRQFHYDAAWNWKPMIENGTEHYHAVYLHSKFLPMSAAEAHVPDLDPVAESSVISIVPLPVP